LNRQIAHLFGLVLVLFGLLVVFTSRWTIFEAKGLQHQTANRRPLLEEQRVPRGYIYADDGTILARDVRKAYPTGHDASAKPLERLAFEWSPDGTTILAVPTEATGHPVVIDPDTGSWKVLDTIFDEQGGASQEWQRASP